MLNKHNDDDNENALKTGQTFLVSDKLLVVPVVHKDSFDVEFYLPKGTWKKVNVLTTDLDDEPIEGGQMMKIEVSIGEIGLFVKQ